jgi:hypothetical protein
MEHVITRDFVKGVLARVQSSSGLPLAPRTIEDYTHRIMTLKKQELARFLNDPDKLYEKLRVNYSKPLTVLAAIKTAAVFVNNLNEQEKAALNFDSTPVASKYREKVTQLNLEAKEQRAKRVRGGEFIL